MHAVRHALHAVAAIVVASALWACAGMPGREPLQVSVADIQALPASGLEIRMLVKLRVQNPNDTPLEYTGVFVKLDILDRTFATGVSDERGSIPRFGEAVIAVPVTASMLRAGLHALGLIGGGPIDRIGYRLEGKLDGPGFGSTRFQAQGEFALPAPP